MDRSAEGFVHERVSNAARNDLPRAVLSYADNLVIQAREILDRHGVALEDLKKPEVRERIPAEDMKHLLGLSAKNAAARRGEIDAAARWEIQTGLEERMKLANETLGAAYRLLPMDSVDIEMLVDCFLRSGMTFEAGDVSGSGLVSNVSKSVKAAVEASAGFDALSSKKPDAWKRLRRAVIMERAVSWPKDERTFEGYFLELLRALPNENFFDDLRGQLNRNDRRRAFVIRTVAHEAARRGIASPEWCVSLGDGTKLGSTISSEAKALVLLSHARAEIAYGKNAEEIVRESIRLISANEFARTNPSLVEQAYRTAALAMGDSSLDRAVRSEDDPRQAICGAVEGLIDAGRYDRAMEFLERRISMSSGSDPSLHLFIVRTIRQLFGRGEISRAESLYARDWADPSAATVIRMETEREYLEARACRGDDVLSKMARISRSDAENRERGWRYASAAIATIGYVTKAKKQLNEYVAKR